MSRAFTGWGRGSRPAMAEGEGGGVAVACRPLPSHRASCRGTSAAVQKSASLSRQVRTMIELRNRDAGEGADPGYDRGGNTHSGRDS